LGDYLTKSYGKFARKIKKQKKPLCKFGWKVKILSQPNLHRKKNKKSPYGKFGWENKKQKKQKKIKK